MNEYIDDFKVLLIPLYIHLYIEVVFKFLSALKKSLEMESHSIETLHIVIDTSFYLFK